MKLSEAIRLGSMQLPPTERRAYKMFDRSGQRVCGACALGAALFAVGFVPPTFCHDYDIYYGAQRGSGPLVEAFPILGQDHGLAERISDLFEEGLTREQVADWVETIEREQERAELAARVDAGGVPA